MDIRHLRYFIVIAEAGSFTAGATRLCVAQPSLTRQIRMLEEYVGSKLFKRGHAGVTLTDAGTVFLDEARGAVSQFERVFSKTKDVVSRTRRLTLGMIPGTEDALLLQVRAALAFDMPNVLIDIYSDVPPALLQALREQRIEAAFVRSDDVPSTFTKKMVRTETLMAIVPSNHRLSRKRSIEPIEFLNEPFVAVAAHVAPAFRTALDAFFLNAGVQKVPDCESETLLSIFSMVASKGFCSLVPSHFSSVLPKSVVGRRLSGQRLNLDLVLAFPADTVSPALNALLERWHLD